MKKHLFIVIAFFCLGIYAQSDDEPVVWEHTWKRISQTQIEIQFKATILEKWHLYGIELPEDGPLPTEFIFEVDSTKFVLNEPLKQSTPKFEYDPIFEIDLSFFDGEAIFTQVIDVFDSSLDLIAGEIVYQACDDRVCVFRSENFAIALKEGAKISSLELDQKSLERSKALTLNLKNKEYLKSSLNDSGQEYPFLNLFLLGFFGGIIALLTPCVFPMIPLTVSFFLKQAKSLRKGVSNALLYGFFIVLIYVILSLPFHFIDSINPEILNSIATNVSLNLLFFAVFILFAFSFFGYYELSLPSSWGNSSDSGSEMQGGLGIFFMALTLAIVSFSCTGPILGSLLAGSLTTDGGAFQLTAGMTGFGFALALPFALFALFPNALNALPKSGGWMTTVKVALGFLELALALKFLSNADLVSHWGLLKREVFLGIWLLLALGLTLYLLGVYGFPHDQKAKLSKTRIAIGGLSLIFTVYLSIGLVSKENTLKLLSGFPPPEFYSIYSTENDCPLGLDCYKDFEEGMAVARESQKPILLDFTGWACVNCRKVEENIWSQKDVYQILKNEVVLISLYVDDRKKLDEASQFNFQFPDGRIQKINTVGEQWAAFQSLNFNTASQPFYVLMKADGTLLNSPIQYTDAKSYYQWLLAVVVNK
jgi:thiol:disulfide interchange protein DsbD